ncbi:MAG TPA: nuclear transport factor 2 family protein [Actinocatenispora sp.]
MDPLDQDAAFFAALTAADVPALRDLLTPDFRIVDVFSGSVADRAAFLDALGAGLAFTDIDATEPVVRRYPSTAVVIGRTTMRGRFGTEAFSVDSRYTHVYVADGDRWRLASAQGTPVTG